MTFSTKLKGSGALNTRKSVMSTSSKLLGVPQRSQSRVMSDIYGTQDAVLLQNGLADEDECDFDAKLESLKPVWEEIAPGFHHWFKSNRSKLFKIASFFLPQKISALKADFT